MGVFSVISASASLAIFKSDINFVHQLVVLFLYLFSLLLVVILWILSLIPHFKIFRSVGILGLLCILILAVLTRFIFLTEYPFVSVGDELREPGFWALKVANGEVRNIFDYGSYEGYGMIIPAFTSIFYRIFGSSVLVYRLPAALVSVANILLLYFLLSFLTKNKIGSFLGTMVLVSLPLHLFYSRTELIVILSSLFSLILLLSLYVFFRRKMNNLIDYIFLGSVIGFTFNLYAGIKAMGMVVFVLMIIFILYKVIFRKSGLVKSILSLSLFVTFTVVGFGPLMLKSNVINFLHTSRLPLVGKGTIYMNSIILFDIGNKYYESLLVWVAKPTIAWYPDHKPIFSPLLFSLMILGILAGIIKKNRFLITIFIIFLILHLTNSALTNLLNGDYRLSPLYPIGALFVGVGLALIFEEIRIRFWDHIIAFMFFIILSFQTVFFFTDQPANMARNIKDYLSMHTIYFIKDNRDLYTSKNLTLFVSPNNYQNLNLLHYKEQYGFFFPKWEIALKEDKKIGDNEIYIKNNEYGFYGKSYMIECGRKNFYCPASYNKNIIIHY